MAILKSLSSGKSTKKAGASPATSSVAAGAKLPGKLPLIGYLPVAQQLRILLIVLGISLLTATALVFLQSREAARITIYISTSTEMQMLSQRIANAVQQAAQGVPGSFPQLKQSREQFIANLNLLENGGAKLGAEVPASPAEIQPVLRDLRKQWTPIDKNIGLILAQEKYLIDLKKLEELIQKTVPRLSLLAQELMISAIDSRESFGISMLTRQLHADLANYNFINALTQPSTDKT